MVKAVIFDLDNTLYAYDPCHKAGLRSVFSVFGTKWGINQRQFLSRYGEARTQVAKRLPTQAAGHSRLLYFQTMLEQLHGRTDYADSLKATDIYWRIFMRTMKLRPGIKAALVRLHRLKIDCALVSDLTTQLQMQKVLQLKLADYFKFLVCSEEVGADKPNPVGMRFALNKLGCRSEQAVMVGDSLSKDRAVARRLNMPFVKVDCDRDSLGLTGALNQFLNG